jgi:hypothetical protein
MDITNARMIATFVEGAVTYKGQKTLAHSLSYAWTSIYTGAGDGPEAFQWLRNNVILLDAVTDVHINSPAWEETSHEVPHSREER